MRNSQNKNKTRNVLDKDQATRKSSILFIQFGLILALLLTYLAIESRTLVKADDIDFGPISKYDNEDIDIPDTTPKIKEIKKPKVVVKPRVLDVLDIQKNDSKDDETPDFLIPDPYDGTIIDIDSIPSVNIKAPVIEDVLPIAVLQEMPIFPGCKGDNDALKKCLSKGISKIIRRNFDAEIAQNIGLKVGKNNIYVMFTIDKHGNVTHIRSNAPHRSLSKETTRVINKIPKLIPGRYKGKNVGVKYSVPITYIVE